MDCGGIDNCTTCQLQDMMRNRRPGLERRIARKLGRDNCWFEEFDLSTRLGIIYTNPETGKRWGGRIDPNCDAAAVDAMIHVLKEKTA
jgi:hypothetical protein